MSAFLRVFAFYICMAALLTWALFALGWNDMLEMPGFEGTRTATPAAVPPKADTAAKLPPPAANVAVAVPQGASGVTNADRKSPEAAIPEPQPPKPTPPPAAQSPVGQPSPGIGAMPSQPAVERTAKPPELAPAPAPAPALPPPAKTAETPSPPANAQIPPIKRVAPHPPEPARPAAAPPAHPAAPPVAQTPPAPPVTVQTPPPAPIKPAAPPTRTAEPAVQPPPASAQVRAAPAAPARPAARRWAPQRRIAGFGAGDLVSLLGDRQKAPDDWPCVVFRNLSFAAGTPRPDPRASAEIDLIAKALNANAGRRIEIGSRLGPGRPMKSDERLRSDRVRVVRDTLIRHGVSPARLLVDPNEAYERVAVEIGKSGGGRVQSIGICIHD